MSMHDEVLTEVCKVATRVRLVASLKDERLNFGAADDVRVFLPDMHIVTHATRRRYRYGTNDMELLADILIGLLAVKDRDRNRTVAVYQVGDFLDLWREEPLASVRTEAADRIMADHPRLMQAILSPALKARFLLGNHDIDLGGWPSFAASERRYFLPPRGSLIASGIALHGDVFDWVEMLPDALNHLFVYFFSPTRRPTDHDLHDVKAIVARNNGRRDFSQQIAGPAAHGHVVDMPSAPQTHNIGSHEFFEKARAAAKKANESFALDLRFVVMGHTHHARIAVHDGGNDDFFALIDCGGWLESAHDASGAQYPNQTFAVLSENEARIYQVEGRPSA